MSILISTSLDHDLTGGNEDMRYRYSFGAILLLSVLVLSTMDHFENNLQERSFTEANTDIENGKSLPARSNEQVSFTNVSIQAGLSGVRGDNLAWGDYNNDGFLDLLVRGNVSRGTMLFENRGPPNYAFEDVTGDVGIDCRGYSIWGDYDNDGNLDFFCADFGDTLWHNEGPPHYRFTNVTSNDMYYKDNAPSEAAAWFDYDNDGLLDIYCTCWTKPNYTDYSWPNYGMPDHLWHNNGDGTFTDVTQAAGVYRNNPAHAAMSIAICDYNDDGWQDVYVGNYHLCPNYLWENQGDGTFIDVAGPEDADVDGDGDYYQGSGPYHGHSAGCAWGDFDNDLDMDLWVSNLAHKDDERSGMNRGAFCDDSQLLDSSGAPDYRFRDIRADAGIPITPSGTVIYDNEGNGYWKDEDYFGCTWGDYDNDGDLDIWIPQVKTYSFWDWCYLWRNNGDRTFTDQAETLGIRVWSNTGAAWGDYDNDGDLDLVTEGTYPFKGVRELHLFRNGGNTNHWLELDLRGTTANARAIGARIILRTGETNMSRIIGGDSGGHGFQNSPIVHFGLDGADMVDHLEIRWPGGDSTELFHVPADQRLVVTQGDGPSIDTLSPTLTEPFEDDDLQVALATDAELQTGDFRVEWDLDEDDIFEYFNTPTIGGEVMSPRVSFPIEGIFNISARLYDVNTHLGETSVMNITVSNRLPTADAGNDILAAEDSIVIFNASGSYDTESDISGLEYRWNFGNGSTTEWNISPCASNSYPARGYYWAEVTTRDDDMAVDSDTLLITVYNVNPEAFVPALLKGEEDQVIVFEGSGEDTANDTADLEYCWIFGDGNASMWSEEGTSTHLYERSGNYTASLVVRDRDGAEGIANVSVRITNPFPTVTLAAETHITEEDTFLAFILIGSDTDSDRYFLEYSIDFGDGSPLEWSTNTTWYHSFQLSGDHTVTAWVSDDDAALGSSTMEITVFNPSPTAAFKISPTSSTFPEDSTIALDASASRDTPSDLGHLNYTWLINSGTRLHGRRTNTSFSTPGEVTITLTVRDDDLAMAKISRKITVENVVPIADFILNPIEIKTGDEITFNATTTWLTPSDADSTFKWNYGDGSGGRGMTTSHSFSKGGDYNIELTVDDGEGGMAKKKIRITVKDKEETTSVLSSDLAVIGLVIILLLLIGVGTLLLILLGRARKSEDRGIDESSDVNEHGRIDSAESALQDRDSANIVKLQTSTSSRALHHRQYALETGSGMEIVPQITDAAESPPPWARNTLLPLPPLPGLDMAPPEESQSVLAKTTSEVLTTTRSRRIRKVKKTVHKKILDDLK